MPASLRAVIRLSIAVLGCLWFFGGIFGVAYAGSDHAWAATLSAALAMLLGGCLVYWALVRAPWERRVSIDGR